LNLALLPPNGLCAAAMHSISAHAKITGH